MPLENNIPELTPELIQVFAGMFLSTLLDQVVTTPPFHVECWKLYSSDKTFVAVAAPRDHAKSTALTYIFGLASLCFRQSSYCVVASASEKLAFAHLIDMAHTLRTNIELRQAFGIEALENDAKGEVIVRCHDGHRFCIQAVGFEQKVRGLKWNNQRPNLILCDDIEDDEVVSSPERMVQARQWFLRKFLPIRAKNARVRFHGTILGTDSLLSQAIKSDTWTSLFYKAHKSFDDFSEILWPSKYDEAYFRNLQKMFIESGDALGYSQEYLNTPLNDETSYLKAHDLIPMEEEDYDSPKITYIGCDFAVATKKTNDRTSFTVGGRDGKSYLHIVHSECGHWDSLTWIDRLFNLYTTHLPDLIFVEGGVIWKAVEPMINSEMRTRNIYLPIKALNSTKSKGARGVPLQKMTRAHSIKFATSEDWWEPLKMELISFTPGSNSGHDDQFDSTAILCRGVVELSEVDPQFDFNTLSSDLEDQWSERFLNQLPFSFNQSHTITGY